MGMKLGLSLTLREEHRLKMFGNRGLSRIFAVKTQEVTGRRRKLHNANFIRVTK
jgi:hypothetical protein